MILQGNKNINTDFYQNISDGVKRSKIGKKNRGEIPEFGQKKWCAHKDSNLGPND